MGKQKVLEKRSTAIRLPAPTWEKLIRLAADRSIKERRSVSVNDLVVEAVTATYN